MKNNLQLINLTAQDQVAQLISQKLMSLLIKHSRILFLVPGGSAAPVAALALSSLPLEARSRISVLLTDERYGVPGHPEANSNHYFDLAGGSFIPVLDGSSLEETVNNYEKNLQQEFSQTSYRLGLFGLGADGHTAGILPGSPVIKSERLVASQLTPTFLRVTVTPFAISQLDEALIFAHGEEKWSVIKQLFSDLEVVVQPAQVLTKLKQLTIFSDYQNN